MQLDVRVGATIAGLEDRGRGQVTKECGKSLETEKKQLNGF